MRCPPVVSVLLLSLLCACARTAVAIPEFVDGGAIDAVETVDAPPLPLGLARDLAITDVAVFQTVRVPLFAEGAVVAPRFLPIIAGRSATVRVYVHPVDGFSPVDVDGELTVRTRTSQVVLRERRHVTAASRDSTPPSVFTFVLGEDMVDQDTELSVRMLAPGGSLDREGVDDPARFPRDGSLHRLGAVDGGPVEVTLVPFRWDADRSGRLPKLSALQLEALRSTLRAMYPVREVRFEVHDPVPWTRGLRASGEVDFGAMLSALRALRAREGAPGNRYYYGLVAPAESPWDYCSERCVYGQAYLPTGPNDRLGRVASGVGFGGEEDVRTFVHELGHAHGRAHAPCGGPMGVDPAYPYPNGMVGVWGYDERNRAFVRPITTDFMGYCRPFWVSDYTYEGLWEWITAVNELSSARGFALPGPMSRPVRHRVLRVAGALPPEWLDALDVLPTPGAASLHWLDADGDVCADGSTEVASLAETAEWHVLVPPGPPQARSLVVEVSGVRYRAVLPVSW